MKKMNWGRLVLVVILCLITLVGCSDKDSNETDKKATTTPTQSLTTGLPTEAAGKEEEAFDKLAMDADLTALEAVKLMGNGINLGNTMEAYGHSGTDRDTSYYEQLWGQPITTKEIVDGMKTAGFDTLRIPIAWTNAMDYESGDYTIDEAYINRVDEIINYALDNEMFVIINDHWDGGWWGMFGSATEETRENAMTMYISMWTQLSEAFGKYGDHLIFEGANEELGDRLNDKDVAKDSGTLNESECYETLLQITQNFVDTVRATGGNNAERILLIPGYNTDIARTCDEKYKMPTDSAADKLLISVHYYTPWGYCGNESLTSWGTLKDYEEQNTLLEMMSSFTKKGYGVVIGEYAVAFREDGSVKDNLCDFLDNFLNNCDLYGYCPVLWDCNGLYNKSSKTIIDKDAGELFASRNLAEESKLTEDAIQTAATEAINAAIEAAKEAKEENTVGEGESLAWLMFNSGDWSLMHSVGDIYDSTQISDGVTAVTAEITGEGTYTVGLDFTGTSGGFASQTVFAAIGIANGETLYPGYVIDIDEIKINGEVYEMKQKPYTSSDDKICTRVNLYNDWVNKAPADARTSDGDLTDCGPKLLDNADLTRIETIEVTFTYHPAK